MSETPQDVVSLYLRAQNLEQVHRTDEAVELYEEAVKVGFDAAGPYDRLIAIYSSRSQHDEVVRVATVALKHVRTFPDKRAWYERVKEGASKEAGAGRPTDPSGAEF